ncbi:MAG: transposase [Halanaerobium sp.]
MAIIPQRKLFDYTEIEKLGDLERLRLVMEYLPDEEFMRHLEKERGNGRNDYPIRGMWNSLLAGIVFEHDSIASLQRELGRNGQLRMLVGLSNKVPTPWAYSRFLNKLLEEEHIEFMEEILNKLIEQLEELLPDFGKRLAIDGKAIESFANSHDYENEEDLKGDRRRDLDADYGKKKYIYEKDGTTYEKNKYWFGYKLHLIVDSKYELPINFEVTPASRGEAPKAHDLIEKLDKDHPDILKKAKFFAGDKGYDDGKLTKKLWDKHQIKPVIDIRNNWQGEETRILEGTENVVYDYQGNVICYDPKTGLKREMAYGGFEKNRETLKYRCPAQHYGLECKGEKECPLAKSIRISISEDKRRFTPLARSSYKWDREYDNRTAIERVNSRLDTSYGFENHTIRGLKKMKLKVSLSLMVMLAMAVGRIKEKQQDKMRSLVQPA